MVKLIASAGLGLATIFASGSLSPKWKADLVPEKGSTVSGNATVEAHGADSTALTISIKGGEINKSYAWHVHQGSCAAGGPVIGLESSYPELQTSASGTAEASVTLGMAPPASGVNSVHVHPMVPTFKSGDTGKKFTEGSVACGDLKPAGDQPE